MSKFDFFDEGVRRVFENYELPLDKSAWANFQSGIGAGASSNLLKAFVLPGLIVAGLFTALHITTPTTQTQIAEHSSTEHFSTSPEGNTNSDLSSNSTKADRYASDNTNSSNGLENGASEESSALGSALIEDGTEETSDEIGLTKNTDRKGQSSSSKEEPEEINDSEKTIQEKLPENMASDSESGTTRTKFLGSRYKLGAPEKFTPNNDNSNNTFMPPKLNENSKFVLRIYDEKGNLIFVSNTVKNPWDGTVLNTNVPAELGDYRWNVILETENKRREYGGNVKLVR